MKDYRVREDEHDEWTDVVSLDEEYAASDAVVAWWNEGRWAGEKGPEKVAVEVEGHGSFVVYVDWSPTFVTCKEGS